MPIERIFWSVHAERRMAERPAVTRDQIESVVRQPDQRFPDRRRAGRWAAQGRIVMRGKIYLLRVFYDPEDDTSVTIAGWYYTSQIRRYWRDDV